MRRLLQRGKWLLGAALLLAALCGLYLGARALWRARQAAWRSAQVDGIYAAGFRYRFEHEFPDLLGNVTFYLSVEGTDPDARLMRLLARTRPAVRRASEWKGPSAVGRRIGLHGLAWISNSEATLAWETPVVALSIWGYEGRVIRTGGRWRVASVTHTYIKDMGYIPRRAP